MAPIPTLALFGAGTHGLHAVLPAILALPKRLQLAAIVEPFEQNRQSAARTAPDVPIFASAEELFAAQTPDIVYIATLPKFHAPLVIQALENGAHVVCEKPLAPSLEECRACIEAAKTADRHLVVMFENRYKAHNRQIREWIQEGRIGRVEALHFQHFWAGPVNEPRRSDLLNASGSLDCGIHNLDLARFFVNGGEWQQIHALGQWLDEPQLANPPHLSILARLESGPLVTFADSMSYRIDFGKRTGARLGPSSLMIVGTHGTIESVAGGFTLFDRNDSEEFCAEAITSHAEEIPWVLNDLLDALQSGAAPSGFLPEGRDGLIAQILTVEANQQANATKNSA